MLYNTQYIYHYVVIVILLLVISIRLDGESEEVEAWVVSDEDGVEAVPAVVSVSNLRTTWGQLAASRNWISPYFQNKF